MKILKRIFYIFLLILLPNIIFAENSQTAAVNELAKLLNNYNTYQANFTASTYEKNGKLSQSSSGLVTLARPGRFRWETLQPFHQILIANGRTLWIYDVDLAEAAKKNIDQKSMDPAILLSQKVKSLLNKFFISKIRLNDQSVWYQLTTPVQNQAFQTLQMRFEGGKLTDIRTLNLLGQTTYFHFTNIQLNIAVDDALFNFVPPANVKILDQP